MPVSSCIKITPVVDVVDIVCLLLRVTQHRSVALTPILRKNRSLAKCVIFYGVGSWGVHPNLKAAAHRLDDENSKIASLRRCITRSGFALSLGEAAHHSYIYTESERLPLVAILSLVLQNSTLDKKLRLEASVLRHTFDI